jgi:hypothetical protein
VNELKQKLINKQISRTEGLKLMAGLKNSGKKKKKKKPVTLNFMCILKSSW